jgi:hypothetical protein
VELKRTSSVPKKEARTSAPLVLKTPSHDADFDRVPGLTRYAPA